MKFLNSSRSLLYWATTLFLLLPGSYILWMLNKTNQAETLALKEEIRDSYQNVLISASKDFTNYWSSLEKNSELESLDPIKILSLTGADSLIIYNKSGKRLFPLDMQLQTFPVMGDFEQAFQNALSLLSQKQYRSAADKFTELAKKNTADDEKFARCLSCLHRGKTQATWQVACRSGKSYGHQFSQYRKTTAWRKKSPGCAVPHL